MNFIAIDFETANSSRTSICSMGVAIVQKGQLVKTEQFYVKPVPNRYDGFNTSLHGISHEQTRDQKTFKEQWKELSRYFHNQTVIAHNAAFDCSVLRYTLDKGKLRYPSMDYYCTYRLAQASLEMFSYTLGTVSRYFGIELQHHNAESDARAAALIALGLCEKAGARSLEELAIKSGYRIGKICGETQTYKPFSKRKVGTRKQLD